MLARLARWRSLRIRVLAGVLLVTVVVLSGFDLAAVTGLRRYLYAQTDSQLGNVLSLYKPYQITVAVPRPGFRKPHVARLPSVIRKLPRIHGPHLFVRPPLFEQYFVVYVTGGQPKAIVGGNQDLKPVFSARLALDRHPETVTSANGRAQLRLRATRLGGGTLLVTSAGAAPGHAADRVDGGAGRPDHRGRPDRAGQRVRFLD
jgi:hypothetical protein